MWPPDLFSHPNHWYAFQIFPLVVILLILIHSHSQQHSNSSSSVQSEMHPAVKSMLGKRPAVQPPSSTMTVPPSEELIANSNTTNLATTNENLKIPRYIPPTLPEQPIAAPVRGEFHCSKKKLVIGNVSRWIPISERDDTASHKWMVHIFIIIIPLEIV